MKNRGTWNYTDGFYSRPFSFFFSTEACIYIVVAF